MESAHENARCGRAPNGILPNLHEIALKRKHKVLPKSKVEAYSQISRTRSDASTLVSKQNVMALPDFIMGKVLTIVDGNFMICPFKLQT